MKKDYAMINLCLITKCPLSTGPEKGIIACTENGRMKLKLKLEYQKDESGSYVFQVSDIKNGKEKEKEKENV